MGKKQALQELIETVTHLRSPKGCPWDRKQTHKSLIEFLRQESRELEQAIKHGSWHDIEDELGDLLLQILMHAQLAKEKGLFDIYDVAGSQTLKLKRRHPHVFGEKRIKTAAQVLKVWQELKDKERCLRKQDLKRRKISKTVCPS
ncbi:MazG nucleotide pyrophosphohydrolase domain-containing protein [Elusimicrobiota bacterium]